MAASALLVAAYAGGAWPLAFVALVPWLVVLDDARTWRGAVVLALAMTAAFAIAAFGWFAPAVADYTGLPTAAALALLLVASPLLQPQILAFALVARLARGRSHAMRGALAVAAWMTAEWAVPRLFGDTYALGLQPSRLLRQGADVAGVTALTPVLLACNLALARALASRATPWRARLRPMAVALAVPALLALYGAWRLSTLAAGDAAPVRIGLVQAAITDYERLRRERGAYAVVREVLDTHEAMSRGLRAQDADAIVWPETVYPTTFGQPRSPAAADFDREIVGLVHELQAPLVFGTYVRDADGEYNAAAFVDPRRGLMGTYRKTRLFPLTEYVPPWLDGPQLRRALPWSGTWRPGDGARVFPLVLADGREVPVAPLICRDDVDPALAREAAQLGAQLLVGLSNDAWFTRVPLGARLHLAAAAFRSVETRLPQVRATTNGLSAVVDATGEVVARTRMGERTVLLAEVRPRIARVSPLLDAGGLLGPVAVAFLVWAAGWPRLRWRGPGASESTVHAAVDAWRRRDHRVRLLRPGLRWLIGLLRGVARVSVLVLAIAAVIGDAPAMLAQLRAFALWVVLPEVAAAALAFATTARLHIEPDRLVIDARGRRIEIDRGRLVAVQLWRMPWPSPGFDLALPPGRRWTHGIALRSAGTAVRAIAPTGDGEPARSAVRGPASRPAALADAFDLAPWRIDHPFVKFVLFPLVPALPAFRLHQLIAYGSAFGEYYSFGAQAYATALLLWWASWAVSLVLVAGAMRLVAELGAAAAMALRPARAKAVRRTLLGLARAGYFIGVPAWLALRLLGG